MSAIICFGILQLILLGLVIFMIYQYKQDIDNVDKPYIMVFIILCSALVLLLIPRQIDLVQQYQFNKNKTITYIKPKIQLIKKTDEYVKYLFDDDHLRTYTQFNFLNTNNFYWKIEKYKSKTFKSLVWTKRNK
jgi:hypothetical protein